MNQIDTKTVTLVRPIKQGIITSGYGLRIAPFNPTTKEFHTGIDIGVNGNPSNVPVYFAKPGKISYINNDISKGQQSGGGFGRVIYVQLIDGYFAIYPHLALINYDLKLGDIVNAGDFAGIMGMTGLSTGIHIHYEERVSMAPGNSREPIDVIKLYS